MQNPTLNDLTLQVRNSNQYLHDIDEGINHQLSHLESLSESMKVDRLQEREDKREERRETKSSNIMANNISSRTADEEESGGGAPSFGFRTAAIAGLVGAGVLQLLSLVGSSVISLFSAGALLAAGFSILKSGMAFALIGAATTWIVKTIANYFGVGHHWDNAIDDIMNGTWSPEALGFSMGALLGAGIGLLVGGLPGMIVGGILGSAAGAIAAALVQDKLGLDDEKMKQLMANVFVGGLAGAAAGAKVGAALGIALGPVGVVVGAILGAALGALVGGLVGWSVFELSDMDWSKQVDELNATIMKWFDDIWTSITDWFMSALNSVGDTISSLTGGNKDGEKLKSEDEWKKERGITETTPETSALYDQYRTTYLDDAAILGLMQNTLTGVITPMREGVDYSQLLSQSDYKQINDGQAGSYNNIAPVITSQTSSASSVSINGQVSAVDPNLRYLLAH